MAAAIEKKVGEVFTLSLSLLNPDGSDFGALPPGAGPTFESSNSAVVSMSQDAELPFEVMCSCASPGSSVISGKVSGGGMNTENSVAIAVLGAIAGPDKEDARIRGAIVVLDIK